MKGRIFSTFWVHFILQKHFANINVPRHKRTIVSVKGSKKRGCRIWYQNGWMGGWYFSFVYHGFIFILVSIKIGSAVLEQQWIHYCILRDPNRPELLSTLILFQLKFLLLFSNQDYIFFLFYYHHKKSFYILTENKVVFLCSSHYCISKWSRC